MSEFEKVIPLIVSVEGHDATNDPSDHGGLTKYGISQTQYPDLDIYSLTEPEVFEILKRDYWDKYGISRIENQTIANQIFLLIINMNPLHAVMIVQVAINACGHGILTAKVDGVLGSETIKCINSLANGWLSNRMRLEAISYYLQLTDNDKTQIKYFRGWVRRALR